MTPGIWQALEKEIFIPVGRHERAVHLRQLGHVTAHHINVLFIRAEHEGMWAVFAATLHRLEVFVLVILVVAVGVGQAMDTGVSAVDVHPQSTVRVEQTLCAGNVDIELLDLDLVTARVDPVQPLVALVAGDDAALVVHTDGNPRSLRTLRHGVEQLGLEALGQLEVGRITFLNVGTALLRQHEDIAPWVVSQLAGFGRCLPALGIEPERLPALGPAAA